MLGIDNKDVETPIAPQGRIHLLPASGMPMSAVLEVNCALGDAPRDRSADGIRVKLETNPTEFAEDSGGSVMFLAMPPQDPARAKSKQQEPDSNAANSK